MSTTAQPPALRTGPTADVAQEYDVGAERAILGALLLAGQSDNPKVHVEAISTVADVLHADDFYRPKHGELYETIIKAYESGEPFDPIAIGGILGDTGRLASFGGAPYLHALIANVPAGRLAYFRDRVLERAERRRFQEGGVRLTQAVAAGKSADDLAAIATSLLEEVGERRSRQAPEMVSLGSLINPALDDIEIRKDRPKGISTGYTDVDRVIGGLNRKELILIAGATGMGKSIVLVDIARKVSIGLGLTVALFSLEMDRGMIFDRVLAAEAQVPHTLIRDGLLEQEDWRRIHNRIGPMSNAPLYISDRAPMRVADIARCCRQLQRSPIGLDLVLVDHMHLTSPSSDRITEPVAKVADVSTGLKRDLAMSLDVPVVAAAQFNRAPAARMDKTPQLTDLRGASNVEQDADKIILVHRPEYYDKDTPRRGEADLIIAKNRNGESRTVTVAAQLHFSRFVDMAI